MTDALVNDKPQFVRLFTENGLNILDYLTNRRLESLYHSLSDSSLAFTLLQRKLTERQGVSTNLVPASTPDTSSPLKSPISPLIDSCSSRQLSLYEVRVQYTHITQGRSAREDRLHLCVVYDYDFLVCYVEMM